MYICGSDEHGVPITVTADREGISPQDVVDRYHEMNKESFEKLGFSFDNYSRTSLKIHHETAQNFFAALQDKKDLTVKESEQYYSESSGRFLPDRYVEGTCPHCGDKGARGDQCDKCGKWLEAGELINPKSKIDGSEPVLKKTRHWYFPMGRFAEEWLGWFKAHKWKENVHNYCMGWYQDGLGDRPITRDLHWGIPVPLEGTEGKVLYVWFDAPIGYISSTKEWAEKNGNPDAWRDYWCSPDTKLVHFIGKDNIVFHAILFPMMLMRVGGYVLPEAIPANEYLTIEGRKISTSQNYAIWVRDYLNSFPPDPLRYALAANAPENKDTDFSWNQFQRRNNDELADILGNFINRTVTFIHKYYNGCVPQRGELDHLDMKMLEAVRKAPEKIGSLIERYEIRKAAAAFMSLCRMANKYFNDKAPWETRKANPESCATTLNICIQITRALGVLMAPILPYSSEKVNDMIQWSGNAKKWDDAGLCDVPEDHALKEAAILFEKIEDGIIQREIEKLNHISEKKDSHAGDEQMAQVTHQQFQKIVLRTAVVIAAEKVHGADRLLKIQVDMGNEKRQLVAGVAEFYSPEQLIGKTVIVVANLMPATIRGIESRGMLLAVRSEKGLVLLTTDGKAAPGLPVS